MRLLSVATFVRKFISRLRKLEEDCERKAVMYLMKLLQHQAFEEELEFLLDPRREVVTSSGLGTGSLPRSELVDPFQW